MLLRIAVIMKTEIVGLEEGSAYFVLKYSFLHHLHLKDKYKTIYSNSRVKWSNDIVRLRVFSFAIGIGVFIDPWLVFLRI